MASTQKIYLGTHPVEKRYLGADPIIINFGNLYEIRPDAFAQYVKLAIPGSVFGSINTNPYDDIHHLINTASSALSLQPTGSTAVVSDSYYYPSGSVVNSGSYNFSTDGYNTSIVTDGTYAIGVASGSHFNFGGNDFVIEVWYMCDEELDRPPFHKPFIQTTTFNPSLEPDGIYTSIFSNTTLSNTNNRFRFQYNQGAAAESLITPNSSGNYGLGEWHHYAIVGNWDAGSSETRVSFYEDGEFRAGVTGSGAIDQTDAYSFLGNIVIQNNNENARWAAQDLRISVGTNRDYTGSFFEPPQSIIQKTN